MTRSGGEACRLGRLSDERPGNKARVVVATIGATPYKSYSAGAGSSTKGGRGARVLIGALEENGYVGRNRDGTGEYAVWGGLMDLYPPTGPIVRLEFLATDWMARSLRPGYAGGSGGRAVVVAPVSEVLLNEASISAFAPAIGSCCTASATILCMKAFRRVGGPSVLNIGCPCSREQAPVVDYLADPIWCWTR